MGENGSIAPDWRRNQAAVTTAAFIGFTGFTLVMPFLPLYLEQLGVRDPGRIAIWSGLSLGVTPAVTAAMAPLWARIADRYGRKLMVARSLGSFVVIMALMAFVTAPWQVFVLRAIQGLFAGYGAIAMTMAAESAPPEHTATAIGWVQTAQRLGPALGPVIGGTLAQALGLRHTFFVSAAFYFVGLVTVVVGYQEPSTERTRKVPASPPRTTTFTELRAVPHFLLFLGTVFGLQLVDRSFGPILPLYLLETGAAADRAPFLSGVIFTITAGSAALGNQLSGWLLSLAPVATVVPAMAASAAFGAFVFGLTAPVAVLLAIAVVFGFGIGVATTATYTATTHAVAGTARSAAFGYLTTAYLTGLAVSPVVAGLVGSLSMRAVFFADAVGLAALAWIVRVQMKPHRSP
jgi:DHA1 family multidrug resistance protein-like MFS transporter